MTRPSALPDLRSELAALLNRHGVDALTNTPDEILTASLLAHLDSFAQNVHRRDQWFGFDPSATFALGTHSSASPPVSSSSSSSPSISPAPSSSPGPDDGRFEPLPHHRTPDAIDLAVEIAAHPDAHPDSAPDPDPDPPM